MVELSALRDGFGGDLHWDSVPFNKIPLKPVTYRCADVACVRANDVHTPKMSTPQIIIK